MFYVIHNKVIIKAILFNKRHEKKNDTLTTAAASTTLDMEKSRRHGDGFMYQLHGPSEHQNVTTQILQMKLKIRSLFRWV